MGDLTEAPAEVTAAMAATEAVARGAAPHLVDGTAVRTKGEALDAIAAALSFPEWFGRNLDALYDCLTDLSWLPAGEHVLIWSRYQLLAEQDPAGYAGVRAVLADATGFEQARSGFSVVLTEI